MSEHRLQQAAVWLWLYTPNSRQENVKDVEHLAAKEPRIFLWGSQANIAPYLLYYIIFEQTRAGHWELVVSD